MGLGRPICPLGVEASVHRAAEDIANVFLPSVVCIFARMSLGMRPLFLKLFPLSHSSSAVTTPLKLPSPPLLLLLLGRTMSREASGLKAGGAIPGVPYEV